MKHELKNLAVFDEPDTDGSGKITVYPFGLGDKRYSSWQKQERFKGRWMQSAISGWAGTSEMGWAHAEMDADHVAAWSKGGATNEANCQMLCRTHNRAKGNR